MRVGILYSGGKDSTYACYLAREEDSVVCLVTLFPSRSDSYMFHYPNARWTRLQAEAMHLPQVTAETEGVKERELDDLEGALRMAKEQHSIEGVYTGALASEYQKSRVERVCAKLGLTAVSPLWHVDQVVHLRNLVANHFDVMITAVAALGLDERWLGRHLDEEAVVELARLHERYRLNPGLEGGEGETFVLDCPLFDRRVEVLSARKHWEGDSGYLEILDARLMSR
jgi:diphthine-ammonia ligase